MAMTLRQVQKLISAARRSGGPRPFPPHAVDDVQAFVEHTYSRSLNAMRVLHDGSLAGVNQHGQRMFFQDFARTVDRLVRKFGPNRTLDSFRKAPLKPEPLPTMPASGSGGGSPPPPGSKPSAEPMPAKPSSSAASAQPAPAPQKQEEWVPTPPAPPPPPKPLTEAEKQAAALENLRQKLQQAREQMQAAGDDQQQQVKAKVTEKRLKADIKAARKRQSHAARKAGQQSSPSMHAYKRAAGMCGRLRKVKPRLRARVADLINRLVEKGSAGDTLTPIPLFSARKVVKRMVVRRPLGNAFKEDSDAGRPVTLFLPDVSPSCSTQAQVACDISNAAGYAGVAGSDVIVFPHSNGEIEPGEGPKCTPWFNGRPKVLTEQELKVLFQELTLGPNKYDIRAVVAVGDHHAVKLYCEIAARFEIKRFVWLHNKKSPEGPRIVPLFYGDGTHLGSGPEWSPAATKKTTLVVGCVDEQTILKGLELSLH